MTKEKRKPDKVSRRIYAFLFNDNFDVNLLPLMQNEFFGRDFHIAIGNFRFVYANAALLDQSASFPFGFRNPSKNHCVHDRYSTFDFFRQKFCVATAKRRLRLTLSNVRFFFAVYFFRQFVREHFFRLVDTLILMRAKSLDFFKR